MMTAIGNRKKSVAEDIDPGAHAPEAAEDDVDADVLVVQQRVAGGEQEDRREQIPLQLEPGVRADQKSLREMALPALTSTHDQDQPGDRPADHAR